MEQKSFRIVSWPEIRPMMAIGGIIITDRDGFWDILHAESGVICTLASLSLIDSLDIEVRKFFDRSWSMEFERIYLPIIATAAPYAADKG